jgi:phosphate starvation-inducible PhoH-like protein
MKKEIHLQNHDEALLLFGHNDRNLRKLRDELGVKVVVRNDTLRIWGEDDGVRRGADTVLAFLEKIRAGLDPGEFRIEGAERGGADGKEEAGAGLEGRFRFASLREPVVPRSAGQVRYLEAIEGRDVVFSVGPAGTGKTFLAVAMGVSYLRRGLYRKIVMVRPAVEAGEKLGFLPGDFQAKVNPYLKPIYDALGDFFDLKQIEKYIEREIFEIVPLAYMRGRTLNDSFIILDEAQNTKVAQMKMLLTRMGTRSKAVITGDITQVDLPPTEESGLVHAVRTLDGIDGIEVVWMTRADIVRHGIVGDIVEAYRRAEEDDGKGDEPGRES